MAPMTRLIRLAAVALLGAANALCPPALAAQSLLILVRHAERPPEVEGDPDLTPAGKARAQKLATMLAESGIRAVFTSEFKRTQETARPLATKLGIPPEVVPAADTSALVDKLEDHPTETVLVVGHADTVAEIIKARGGPTVTIADDQFDDIFVFVPATGALTRIKY